MLNLFKQQDAELDIENSDIALIEREGNHTVITFHDGQVWDVNCSLEKHNDFLVRFRRKLCLK